MAENNDVTNTTQDLQNFNNESATLVVTLQDLAKVLRENAKAASEFTGESAAAYQESFKGAIDLGKTLSGYTVEQLKNRKSEATFLKQVAKLEQDRSRVQSKISYLQDKFVNASDTERKHITKTLTVLSDVSDTLETQVEHANKLKNTFEEINKKVKVFDDLSDFFQEIPGVSKVFGEFQKAADAAREAAATGGNSLSAGAKELSGALTKGLAAFGIATLVKGLGDADERSVELGRNLNKSAEESARLVRNFNSAARGIQGLTGADLQKGATLLADSLGTTAVSSITTSKELAAQTKYLGISADEAAKQAEFSQATGQDIAKAGNAMRGEVILSNLRNKTGIKYQAIMKDIAGTSNATKLLITGQGKSLTSAATEAKKLGTTMEGIANIGKSMLDFESSIANELEAELLTGGEINNEKARALALMGDTEGLAKEVAASGVLAKFEASKNVLQQEALAKAYGMSKEEMADMVVKSKAMTSMNAGDQKDLEKKYSAQMKQVDLLRSQGKIAEANNLEAKLSQQIGNEELERQMKNQTFEEKKQEAMSKLAEAMDKMLPIIKAVAKVFEFIGEHAESLSKVLLVLTGASLLGKIANMAKMLRGIGTAAKSASGGVESLANTAQSAAKSGGTKGVAAGKGLAATAAQAAAQATPTTAKGAVGAVANTAKEGLTKSATSPTGFRNAAGQFAKAPGAAAPMAEAAASGGGFFSNLVKGGKGLLSKINPVTALKAATKEAGGFSKLLGKAVKGSALNTILTGFFAYNDIKDLVNNPVDENGKPLSEKLVNQKVGQIAAGGLGGILGGMIGAAVGGPIGSMVGSFGGEWLFKSLAEAFPEGLEGLGGMIVPLAKDKKVEDLPKYAKGGIFTSASAGIIGEAGPEAVVPLAGFYNKIDQLIKAVQLQKTVQIQKVDNKPDKSIQPITPTPVITTVQQITPLAPKQEIRPLTVKQETAPAVQTPPPVRDTQNAANNAEVVTLLRELIVATKQGKPVYLDSNKVNAALGQSMYTVGG